CSFLGFQGPAWVRAAIGAHHEPHPHAAKAKELPALGRAAATVEEHASPRKAPSRAVHRSASKTRRASAKKNAPRRAPSAAKKNVSSRTARERTESLRSSL